MDMVTDPKIRRTMEKKIARKLVEDAIRAGYSVSVDNGEEIVLHQSTDADKILSEMFSVDEEHLYFSDRTRTRIGFVFLVYGNEPWNVICDYSQCLESLLIGVNQFADGLENKFN